jgi:hypothetical protein
MAVRMYCAKNADIHGIKFRSNRTLNPLIQNADIHCIKFRSNGSLKVLLQIADTNGTKCTKQMEMRTAQNVLEL